MKRINLLLLIMFFFVIVENMNAAASFPFPTNDNYGHGIRPTNVSASDVQEKFDAFKAEFYEEQGSLARIKWDTPSQTVSEGIAYGMLIMVYMDNSSNDTQDEFDKLWAYYNEWMNNNGLMNWKIEGFSSVIGNGAATDAEVDAAVALLMAYKQWGDNSYLEDAKILIGNIWDHEVNGNYYLKPGDQWDSEKNPSYFSTAALELFKEVDSHDWSKVISKSYDLLYACRNSTSGLVPDWCDESGNPSSGDRGGFSWDAVRTPWRMAWAYVWYGHSDAKDIAGKMAEWIKGKTGNDPSNIVNGYNLNGDENASDFPYKVGFTGAFTCAGLVDAAHQTWVDDGYILTRDQEAADNYYQRTLVVMYLLLLSGNYQNLWNYSGTEIKASEQFLSDIQQGDISEGMKSGKVSVRFNLSTSQNVSLSIIDARGVKIETVFSGFLSEGIHNLDFATHSICPGVYIILLKGEKLEVKGKFVKLAR